MPLQVVKQILIGQIKISLPIVVVMIGLPILLGALLIEIHWLVFWIGVLGGAYLGYLLSWWYWARQIVKWRLSAFSAVPEDDWLALYRAAVRYKLIWPNGHVANLREQRSEGEKEYLTLIEERLTELLQVEEINDSFITAERVDIKAKATEILAMFGVFTLLLALGVGLVTTPGVSFFLGLLFIPLALYRYYQQIPYLLSIFRRRPVLSFGPEAIEYNVHQQRRAPWQDLTELSFRGDFAILFVAYSTEEVEDSFEIDLSYLATDREDKFRRLLKLIT